MFLHPVLQCQLVLGKSWQNTGIRIVAAQFFCHLGSLGRDARIVFVFVICDQKIEFGVLLHGNTKVIQRLDRSIAGKEIVWTRAKGEDFQSAKSQQRSGNRKKFANLLSNFLCGTAGIFGNVHSLVAQSQIVAGVEHTAECVAASVVQVAVSFGSAGIHQWTIKHVRNHGFRCFRSEVTEINTQGIDAGGFDIFDSFAGIQFIFHADRTFIESLTKSSFYCGAAAFGQGTWKAGTGNSDQSHFYLRNICNHLFLSFIVLISFSQ